METGKNFIVKNIERGDGLIKDVRSDGNVYVLSGLSDEKLIDMAVDLTSKLNRSPFMPESTRSAIMAGEEVRPQGAYAISLRNNKLYVELRNGAGNKVMMDELKTAIDSI